MIINRIITKIRYYYDRRSSESYIEYLRRKGIVIGEGTYIQDPLHTEIDDTRPSLITIGNDCFFNSFVEILSHDWVTHVFLRSERDFVNSSGRIIIGNNVAFGRHVMVLKGVTIGDNCFIGANSMSEEIRRTFNDKAFSYISEVAILKSRSKIKVSAFEQLLRKFNDTLENPKKYKSYRVIAVDGSDFSSLYSADSQYATISNQYGGANRIHINFAYDILNKNFLDCVIETKNKADERKGAVKMLSALCESEKILAIMDRGYDGLKIFEHCNRIKNLSYLIRIRSGMTK